MRCCNYFYLTIIKQPNACTSSCDYIKHTLNKNLKRIRKTTIIAFQTHPTISHKFFSRRTWKRIDDIPLNSLLQSRWQTLEKILSRVCLEQSHVGVNRTSLTNVRCSIIVYLRYPYRFNWTAKALSSRLRVFVTSSSAMSKWQRR